MCRPMGLHVIVSHNWLCLSIHLIVNTDEWFLFVNIFSQQAKTAILLTMAISRESHFM